MTSIFFILLVIVPIFGHQLPSDFKICHRSDPNPNECLKTAIQDALQSIKHGLPSFQFPSIDPINIESLSIGAGTGAVHFVQNYKNIKVYGVPSIKVSSVELQHSENDGSMFLTGTIDEIRLEADYDINGQIMVMNIVGKGKCVIKLLNVDTKITINANVIQKKGVDYSNIEEFLVNIEPKKMVLQFDNLFDGDEVLSAEIHKVVNDNWSDVFNDVKSGYEESLGVIFKTLANQIYNKVPVNDMFPL